LFCQTWILDYHCQCENPINYNPNKINKILNRLNKKISGIVKGYDRIKKKVLWCKLSKKNYGTKIKIKSNKGQFVNTRKIRL